MMDSKKKILHDLPRITIASNPSQTDIPYLTIDPAFNPYQDFPAWQDFEIPFATVLKTVGLPDQTVFAIVSHYLTYPSSLHSHDYVEMLYLPQGKLLNVINHVPYTLAAGSVCLINPHTAHFIAQLPTETAKPLVINLMISMHLVAQLQTLWQPETEGSFLPALFAEKNFLIFQEEELLAVHHFLDELIMEYYRANYAFSPSVVGYFLLFFDQLAQLQQHPAPPVFDALTTHCLRLIKHQPTTISLELLAQKLNYSKGYLSRHIKEQTHKTIAQIIMEEKLALAETYLTESALSVSAIAEAVGYQSESHFYRLFKHKFKFTPKQYRHYHQHNTQAANTSLAPQKNSQPPNSSPAHKKPTAH